MYGFAFMLFGSIVKKVFKDSFKGVKKTLKRANMKISIYEYLSMIMFTLFLITIFFLGFFFVLYYYFRLNIFFLIILPITLLIAFLILYMYPGFVASNRRRDIESKLAYSVTYMSAMAEAGVAPIIIFENIAKSPLYGEITEEAKNIAIESKIFGKDIVSVLADYSFVTPSKKFSDLLQGIVTTIRSGGDLNVYLKNKADGIMFDYRETRKEFTDTLGIYSEIFISFIFLILLLIVTISIFKLFSAQKLGPFTYDDILNILTYIVVPGFSILFILLLDAIYPEE
ncbi:MAG: type II secretion system F family protein [Methanomicrobia archaeon]|nr:type II secretion system F family protein [Methanomicrobia archaeon]